MRWLVGILTLLLLSIAALLGAAWWLVDTEGGTEWLLERTRATIGDRLVIEGVQGALARELRIDRVLFTHEAFRLEVRDIRARADLASLLAVHLGVRTLHAQSATLTLAPSDKKPPTLPDNIGLPLRVRIAEAEIAQLSVVREPDRHELQNVAFRYEGGPLGHEVRRLRAELPWGGIALDGEIAAMAPFGVEGTGALSRPDPRYPAGLGVEVRGDLRRLHAALTAKLADVTARGEAVLTPFAPHWLESIRGDAGPIDLTTINRDWPRTAFTVTFNARPKDTSPLAGTLSLLNSQPGALDQGRLPITRLSTRFTTDFSSGQLDELRVTLAPGGTLAGSGEVSRTNAAFTFQAAGLDLRAFRTTLRQTQLNGPLKIVADADRQAVQGTLSQEGMTVTADAVREGDNVDVRSFHAAAKGGELTGTGRLRLGERLAFDAKLALARFDPSQFGDYPPGSISGSVTTSGRLGEPRLIEADWSITESRLHSYPFTSRGRGRVAGADISDLNAEAHLGASRLTARGALGRRGNELAWTLEAPQLEQLTAQLLTYFGPQPRLAGPWSGRLRASGSATGDLKAPRTTLTAQLDALGTPFGVAAKLVNIKGAVGVGREAPFDIDFVARGISLQEFAFERFELRTAGALGKHQGEVAVRGNGFEVTARLHGGWNEPRGWSGEVLALRNRGDYPLDLVAPVALQVAPGQVRLGRFDAKLGEGRILVHEAAWQVGRLLSSGEFNGLPAAWVLVPAGLGDTFKSNLLLDGQWSLRSTPRLNGTLFLRRASGDLIVAGTPAIDLGLRTLAINARFVEGRILAESSIESRQAKVALRGEVSPAPGAAGLGINRESPVEFNARLDFTNVRALAQPLLTQGRVDGRIAADLRGKGTLGKPVINGELRGEALSVEVPPYGVYLRDGQLRASLEGDRLRVTEFAIRGGDGRFTASGTLPLRFAEGAAELGWQAKEFRLLNRPDMRLVVSGNGAAGFDGKRLSMKGTLRANQGYFEVKRDDLPQLGPDVVVVGQPRPVIRKDARVPVALDLSLDLGDDLYVRGWGLQGEIAGRVHVLTTENGEPRAYGRINAVDATFMAYGQRLRVDPGVLIFDGAIDNPTLELTAWRRNQAVDAGVQLSGTLRSPRVQLVSQPPVPEGERLSWLVLGRAPGNASQADLALLQAAAGALLPRGRSAPINQRIATAFGLDEVTLRGGSQVADRVVAFGKRLSDRLYVTYEQGLGATAANLVKLDFSLTDRLSVRAETGTASGLGLFYRFSWD